MACAQGDVHRASRRRAARGRPRVARGQGSQRALVAVRLPPDGRRLMGALQSGGGPALVLPRARRHVPSREQESAGGRAQARRRRAGTAAARRKFVTSKSSTYSMRRLVLGIVTLLVIAAAPSAGAAPAKNLGCGNGKLMLNVSYRVSNDVDTGLQGNNWAFDDYTRALRVVRKTGNRFCAGSTYDGTFT